MYQYLLHFLNHFLLHNKTNLIQLLYPQQNVYDQILMERSLRGVYLTKKLVHSITARRIFKPSHIRDTGHMNVNIFLVYTRIFVLVRFSEAFLKGE